MTPEAPKPTWSERLSSPRLWIAVAVGLGAGGGGALLASRVLLAPKREIARRRFETVRDVMKLYGLQVQYRKAKGVYANDLDALLALAPDGAALKAGLGDHLDPATLTVVGDSTTFKVEANVLDADRTLVRIKGPIIEGSARKPAPVLPTAPGSEPGEGKPVDGR